MEERGDKEEKGSKEEALEIPKEGERGEVLKEKEQEEQIEAMEEDEAGDMELGELDLDKIEKECEKKGKGYVSRRQLELLQELIIKMKA